MGATRSTHKAPVLACLWRRKTSALVLLVALLAVLTLGSASLAVSPGIMTLHVIDVGQGDALLLSMPNGQHLLVDGGTVSAGPAVVAYLDQQGVAHLDLIIATHAHADHIGGLPHVISSLPVAAVWADSWDCTSQTCLGFYDSITAQGIPTDTARAGHVFVWGDVQGLVVHPAEPLLASYNDRSVTLRVTYGGVSMLLTGDAEAAAELQMLDRDLPLQAEVLKVGHHGSDTSTTEAFLTAVAPEHAVISVGAGNNYGHPGQAALERLTEAGVEIWRTDLEGDIVVSTDGETLTLVAGSGRRAPPLSWKAYLPIMRGPIPPPDAIQAKAWVSDPEPLQFSTVTVYGSLAEDGQGVAGVPMETVWHYRTTTATCSAKTDSSGVAACTRSIGGATAGYYVRIDVDFLYQGQTYSSATGFTPTD